MKAFALVRIIGLSLVLLVGTVVWADPFPKVDADLDVYDAAVQKMNDEFARIPADSNNQGWVIKKLQHMVDTDQYMRKFPAIIYSHQYTQEEQTYFFTKFGPKWQRLDQQNTTDLKSLLAIYSWFNISKLNYIRQAPNVFQNRTEHIEKFGPRKCSDGAMVTTQKSCIVALG